MPRATKHLKKHQFKKGEPSANPLGGKLHNPEIRALKNLTESEMIEIGSLVLKGSIKELREIAKDENQPALKAMIAGVAVRTISTGDPAALEVLLNRLIGKVKERVHFTGHSTQAIGVVDMQKLKDAYKKIKSDV